MRTITAILLLTAALARGEGMRLEKNSPVYAVTNQPALDLTTAFTLEAWVQADTQPGGGGRILDRHIPNGGQGYVLDTHPGNSLRLLTSAGSARYDARLPSNRWIHIVAVFDATNRTQKLYLDGAEVASANIRSERIRNVPVPLTIGRGPNGNDVFAGRIKRAALYPRALTLREIIRRSGAADPAPLPGVLGDWILPETPGEKIQPVAGTLVLERAAK